MREIISCVAFFCCLAQPLFGQVDVSARLDSSYLMIGDQVELQVLAGHGADVAVTDVDVSAIDTSAAFEIISLSEWDTISGYPSYRLQRRLVLTSFEPGSHVLPPVRVSYRSPRGEGTAQTQPLTVSVRDFPPDEDPNRLMPIKPIVEEPLALQDVLPYLIGVLALGLIIALVLLWWRRRKQAEAPPAPEVVRPPHEVALEKLRTLRTQKLWQRGENKQFQSELSYILREYLERRFEIPALERTSRETLERLAPLGLAERWEAPLRDVFQVADLVKFAKATPTADLHDRALQTVEDFVHATIPAPVTEDPASETQNADNDA